MFDLIFYDMIRIIRDFKKICDEHKKMMCNRYSFTIKDINEMDLFLDNTARRFHHYMDNFNLRPYIISYREYFNMKIPIYIEQATI